MRFLKIKMSNREILRKDNINISEYLSLINPSTQEFINFSNKKIKILVLMENNLESLSSKIFQTSLNKILKSNEIIYTNSLIPLDDFEILIYYGNNIEILKQYTIKFYSPIYVFSKNIDENFDNTFNPIAIIDILKIKILKSPLVDQIRIGILLDTVTSYDENIEKIINKYLEEGSEVHLLNYDTNIINDKIIKVIDQSIYKGENICKYISKVHLLITDCSYCQYVCNKYGIEVKNLELEDIKNTISNVNVNEISNIILNKKRKIISDTIPNIDSNRKIQIKIINSNSNIINSKDLLNCLYNLTSEDHRDKQEPILIDIDIEYTFSEYINNYNNSWVGFVHNYEIEYLLENPSFINSLLNCRFLICMSQLIKEELHQLFERYGINIKLVTLKYPLESVESIGLWDINKYSKSKNKSLIQMYSNDPFMIYELECPDIITKYTVEHNVPEQFEEYLGDVLGINTFEINESKVINKHNLWIKSIIKMLSYKCKSVNICSIDLLFTNDNLILMSDPYNEEFIYQCINYSIPILTNKNKLIISVLGNDYLGYYETPSELISKLTNYNLLKEISKQLNTFRNSLDNLDNNMKYSDFLNEFQNICINN